MQRFVAVEVERGFVFLGAERTVVGAAEARRCYFLQTGSLFAVETVSEVRLVVIADTAEVVVVVYSSWIDGMDSSIVVGVVGLLRLHCRSLCVVAGMKHYCPEVWIGECYFDKVGVSSLQIRSRSTEVANVALIVVVRHC